MARAKRKTTTHAFVWRSIMIEIHHTRDYLYPGTDHIELHVKKPKAAVLPITDTGYRSEFVDAEELATIGGPVLYVQQWLDREAATKRWRALELKAAQLDFFPLLEPKKPKRRQIIWGSGSNGTESRVQTSFGSLSGRSLPRAT